MSHTIKVGKWTVYHNGDFSGDVAICIPEDQQTLEPNDRLVVPMEVLRAIVAAEIRSKAIGYYESATDEAVLNKVTGF